MVKKMIYVLMLLIVIVVLIFIAVLTISQWKVSSQELVFRFEDYHIVGEDEKSAESAQKALRALYPIGTPVERLVDGLQKTDTECIPSAVNSKEKYKSQDLLIYTCTVPSRDMFAPPITRTDWVVEITQENSLIRNIAVTFRTWP